MSYNGSGTFNINTAGQPVVTGTVISSTAFNALTADLGTGLSTAITKDGQTIATAKIPFALGISINGATSGVTSVLATDAVTATITLPSATGTLAVLGANTFTGKQTATTAGIDVPTSALGNCYSSTYTPSVGDSANISAMTAYACQYTRVGNVVTVSGRVDIDPVAAATYTSFWINFPVASNLASGFQCAGTCSPATASAGNFGVFGDATNDRAQVDGVTASTSNQALYFIFSYQVI
jgi:hypothetical protein